VSRLRDAERTRLPAAQPARSARRAGARMCSGIGGRDERRGRLFAVTARQTAVAGFTLIEVLAALVIVSLGMLGVIQAVGQTASNTSYLREKTLAHWVAMNRLTEARLQPAPPKVDTSSDEIEMGGRRWRWTMEVTQTPVESIRRIDISVRPAEADKNSSLATITGFYGTAIAPAGSTVIRWQGTLPGDPGRGGGRARRPPNNTSETGENAETDGAQPPADESGAQSDAQGDSDSVTGDRR